MNSKNKQSLRKGQSNSQAKTKPSRGASKKTAKDTRTLIYGIHAVQSVLARYPERIKQVFIQASRDDERVMAVVNLAKTHGLSVQQCERATLDAMSSKGQHQGVVADINGNSLWQESDLKSLLASVDMPLILALDGVTDPHNLGACLRVANGAGVHAVIAPKDNSASLTAVARKVASGAGDVTPFIQVSNLSRTLQALKEQGLWVIGLADKEDASLYEADLNAPLVLVMGAEGKGIRRLTREQCDQIASLPMLGNVSSLNVSVAAGVCLYECVRQRRM